MPSQISVTAPVSQTTIKTTFWNTEIGKIVNALNELIQGLFGSTDITTTGDVNARDFVASRNIEVANDLTVTNDIDVGGDIDVNGTLETNAITLNAAAVDEASGICTLTASSIVKGKRMGAAVSKSSGTVYQADSDGYVVASRNASSSNTVGYSDAANPPTTIITSNAHYGYSARAGICMPVRKNEHYKVVGTVDTMFFIPSGD